MLRRLTYLVLLLLAASSALTVAEEVVQKPQVKQEGPVSVLIQTNKGVITLELDRDKAPVSVANFIEYANAGFYDGTIFHRVIPGFMVQGGGFTPGMQMKRPNNAIKNEANNGLKNVVGTVAMARTGQPHSATSQFFINVKDNAFLNHKAPSGSAWGYAVFGRVTAGMDVVTKIENVETGMAGRFRDVPKEDVIIEKVMVQ